MSFLNWYNRRKQRATLIDPKTPGIAGTAQTTRKARRYLANSDYLLPKDQGEEFRLNFQHHALYHAIGSHYVAPLAKNTRLILDVGTGTGIWSAEMARLFPHTEVVGIDVDTTLFKTDVPDNCLLRAGDVLTGLPFPDAFFGYTHQRLLTAAVTATKWPGVIRELIRVTRPGGWIECVEIDNQMQNTGPAGQRLQSLLQAVGASMGFDGEVIRHLGDLLKQEGLKTVEAQPILIPVGEWGGRVGSLMKHDFLKVLEAIQPLYCERGNITPAEFEQLVQTVAGEWETTYASCTFLVFYGKREHP
jgi:ubiquinone/menaquinone biosynthesis C-methylase UbiE